MGSSISNKPWPKDITEKDPEYISQIKPEYVQSARFWENFDYDWGRWTDIEVNMIVNGWRTCLHATRDWGIIETIWAIVKSDDFYRVGDYYTDCIYHRITPLTEEIVSNINSKDIIYAEVTAASTTHPNGKSLIYIKNLDHMRCYCGHYNSDNESEKKGYLKLLRLLADSKKKKILDSCTVLDTTAYIDRNIPLSKNDDENNSLECIFGVIRISSKELFDKVYKSFAR